MPRIDKTMLKSQGGSFPVGSERTVVEEVQQMEVFKNDAELFTSFVVDVYDALAAQYVIVSGGRPMDFPVTQEEFVKYAFTAMKTRVSRINNNSATSAGVSGQRWPIRTNDVWQLPSVIAAAINGIGIVTLEAPVVTLVPVWNPEYDNMLLTVREWHSITQRLFAVARNSEMKVVFVKAIADDKFGDEALMSLIPIRDELGRIVRLGSHHTVDTIAAVVYLLAGFDPDVYAGLTLATHPMLLPPYYVTAAALHQGLWRLANVA
jgi:hypothetical protein